MNSSSNQYHKIAEAIAFIGQNFKSQPSLDQIAAHLHLSPFHFQRLFEQWVGVSPKKFLQYTSLQYAKSLLLQPQSSLFNVADETGLSGTGRLHDLFVKIEAMTPGQFKNGGKNLQINYSFANSPFGDIIVASTDHGICYLSFVDTPETGFENLKNQFPNATYISHSDEYQETILNVFNSNTTDFGVVKLHLKGTKFQLKVWEALLQIPQGKVSTYGKIAEEIKHTKASRAVGTAIGSNPIAYVIPCHRVIQSSGLLGGYMWGVTRKTVILAWEAVKCQ